MELTSKEDLQQLLLASETAKIQLSTFPETRIDLYFQSLKSRFRYRVDFSLFLHYWDDFSEN